MRVWPGKLRLPKSIHFSQIPGKGYYQKYLKAVLSKRGRKER